MSTLKTLKSRVHKRINYLSWYILNLKMFFPECEGGESKKSLSIEINFRSAELEGLLELIDGYTIKTIQKKGIIQTELNGEVLLHLNIDECCEYNTMYHEKMFSYLNTEVYGRKFKVEYILPDFALEYEV